ncbi:MAG: chemotaxis protein CheW [Pseudomonadota bacterium]
MSGTTSSSTSGATAESDAKLPVRAGAKAPVLTGSEREETKYLTFMAGGTGLGMHILRVKEILEHNRVDRVPMASSLVRGVINLRGQVVPVIDLAVRLGEPPSTPSRRSCIIIVDLRQGEDVTEIGFMVDSVTEVVEIPDDMIEPAPAFGADMPVEFIQGMGKVNGAFVTLLQLERVFDLDEMARLAA